MGRFLSCRTGLYTLISSRICWDVSHITEFASFPRKASAPTVQLQESALRIFSSVPGIFSNQHMLVKYLDLPFDPEVRFQAVCAVGAFILLRDKEDDDRQFGDLLPRVIIIPAEIIYEVIVSLSENAPGMLRKRVKKYLSSVPLVLQMMTDLENDDFRLLSLTCSSGLLLRGLSEENLARYMNGIGCGNCGEGFCRILRPVDHPKRQQRRSATATSVSSWLTGRGCRKSLCPMLETHTEGDLPEDDLQTSYSNYILGTNLQDLSK
ncbi:importin beta-3 [Culex quinquefasciatus]|uniref:Importin beta-3 n=1 Tax=Culex quinquefasciatus TaxID=7176 RepID=B0XDE2_CULQU|nr:importin beta-3 [Culex quinquefasciatus]|eukprot:XP_001867664.1 importin beta-3 [Culex quinquefasciatus]